MRITLTRTSLSMGDDFDAPHYADLDVPDEATLADALDACVRSRYPFVRAGDRFVVWLVMADEWARDSVLAAVQGPEIAFLADPGTRFDTLPFRHGPALYLRSDHASGPQEAVRAEAERLARERAS